MKSFQEFWPFYLAEHSNRANRRLHFTGTTLGLLQLIAAPALGIWWLALTAFATGYTLAWVGHFVYEKNRPATFQHPWFSFVGDWKMWALMLAGKLQPGSRD